MGTVTVSERNLEVTVGDNDNQGVTVSSTSLEVTEGASGVYTIVLDTQPTGDPGNVTVTITGDDGDVTVNPSQLTFTAANWNQAEEVTVNAADDADAEPDAVVTLKHTVRGADYDGVDVEDVRVTIKESDTKGVTVSSTSLEITEGGSRPYTVVLTTQPTGAVTVMVGGVSGTDVSVDPEELIFTTGNWSREQTVTVSAAEDDDAAEDAAVTLTHTASGGGYDDAAEDAVTVTIVENDTERKGVTVTPRALTINEGSMPGTYTVRLTTQPTAEVTMTVSVSVTPDAEAASVMVSPKSLEFTPDNWNVRQMVTVSAAEDANATDAAVTLMHVVSGGDYATGVEVLNVNVTVRDNDEQGVTVSPRSLEITEGESRAYTVVLDTQPTSGVTVNVGGVSGDVSVSPSTTLTFTPSDWFTARRVTVSAAEDDDEDDDTATLTHTVSGGDYAGAEDLDVNVTVRDNDTAGVAVNPTSLEITEGGRGTYTVVLTKRPTATVTVRVAEEADGVSVRPPSLRFTTGNWNVEQEMTVTVAEDDDALPDAAVLLTHTVSGGDYGDGDVAASPVTVTIKENDTKGVTVNPTSLTIGVGTSGTYRVRLNTQPTDEVRVTVSSPPAGVTVSGSPLIFDTSNWSREQTVTVSVSQEAAGDQENIVTLMHTVSGGDYSSVTASPVTVIIPIEGAPSAPTGLTATAGDRSVALSWGAPADDGGSPILRYQYRYQESGGSYSGWATVPGGASATSYTVTGLNNGTTYEFQVRAANAIGAGAEATAGATLAESAPEAPAGLTASGGDESVTLSWAAPATGGSQILRYEFRYAALNQTYSDWMEVDGGGGATGITISGLTNGTEYGFQVRAVNAIDEGPASMAEATPGTAPSVPMGLAATVGDQMVTLMWAVPADDGGSAILRYELCYRESGAAGSCRDWMEVGGGAEARSTTIMDLDNGRVYEFQVRAVNGLPGGRGNGEASMVEVAPMEGLDFAHFINGTSNGVSGVSDLVLVNVDTSTVSSAIYFYNRMGGLVDPASLVGVMGDLEDTGDGGVVMDIEGLGETTVSTNGEGALVTGSVKVFSTGRVGGVLRFDIRGVGVAGVGASQALNDAIFPARRMAGGINTGTAIRNLSPEPMMLTCRLMQSGEVLDTRSDELKGDGQGAGYIDQLFPDVDTSDFEGSVRCTAPEGGMFTGVALEMDIHNQIFTTLPLVPVDPEAADAGMSTLNFAHFGNGDIGGTAMSSDLVFVNVANTAVAPAIYFYAQDGSMIAADTLVDAMMEGLEVAEDGALMVMDEIAPMGEMTISTNGLGSGMVGSVKVVSDGPIGGIVRFDIPGVGVAGVGASEAVNAAIFPARRMAGGINTGAAIHSLEAERMRVTCRLMQGGEMVMDGVKGIDLPANGQEALFIDRLFMDADTDAFEGSVHCSAPEGGMFTGVALEMDVDNQIFTTLPVVPVQ